MNVPITREGLRAAAEEWHWGNVYDARTGVRAMNIEEAYKRMAPCGCESSPENAGISLRILGLHVPGLCTPAVEATAWCPACRRETTASAFTESAALERLIAAWNPPPKPEVPEWCKAAATVVSEGMTGFLGRTKAKNVETIARIIFDAAEKAKS